MIYPIPQKNNLNGNKIKVEAVKLSGDFCSRGNKILDCYNIKTDGGFKVEIKITDTKKTTYIDELSRLTNEKYFITVTEDKAIIESSSERGAFRGVHTL